MSNFPIASVRVFCDFDSKQIFVSHPPGQISFPLEGPGWERWGSSLLPRRMKTYDVIALGSGSGTNILDSLVRREPGIKIAFIDKDEPGGICLTRGCIPSKMLVYPAELVWMVERASQFGIEAELKRVDFLQIMERMRASLSADIEGIRNPVESPNIDYFPEPAEFIGPMP
jgi:dihydrolipoamide dehydrogenase